MIYVAILEGLVLVMTIAAFAVAVWRVKSEKRIGTIDDGDGDPGNGSPADAQAGNVPEGPGDSNAPGM